MNNFTECYNDAVYVSANPYIRNKSVSYKHIEHKWNMEFDEFISEDHFYKIIDVLINGWDDELNTVHPRTMNHAALYALKNHPDRRLILHYMQPHTPYICRGAREKFRFRDRVVGFLRWRLMDVFGKDNGLKIGRYLGLSPIPSPMEKIVQKGGIELLKQVYEENLRIVLEYVQGLLGYLRGKIIIAADHGELLGEYGLYGHYDSDSFERKIPQELIEIPWLEIVRHNPRKEVPDITDYEEPCSQKEQSQEIIKERLKSLGYLD